MKNKMRIFSNFLSFFVLTAFIKALFAVKSHAIANQYFDYKMYRIVAYCYQKALNKATLRAAGAAIIVYLILLVSIFLIKKLCEPVFIKTFTLKIKDSQKSIRIICASFVSLTFLIYDGWLTNWLLTNHYWFRDKPYNFVLKLLINSTIVPLSLVLWFILIHGRWERLWRLIIWLRPFIVKAVRVSALSSMIVLLPLNFLFEIYQAKHQPSGPNVILIQIETLRPDHLSCYGYERDTKPKNTELKNANEAHRNSNLLLQETILTKQNHRKIVIKNIFVPASTILKNITSFI